MQSAAEHLAECGQSVREDYRRPVDLREIARARRRRQGLGSAERHSEHDDVEGGHHEQPRHALRPHDAPERARCPRAGNGRACSGMSAKTQPVTATSAAPTAKTSSTPPARTRSGMATAATVPPSGTAIWRTPSAQARPRSGIHAEERARTGNGRRPQCPHRTGPAPRSTARSSRRPRRARAPLLREPCPPASRVAGRSGRRRCRRRSATTLSRARRPPARHPAPRASGRTRVCSSGPTAGKPKLTNETAACETVAPASTALADGPSGTAGLS